MKKNVVSSLFLTAIAVLSFSATAFAVVGPENLKTMGGDPAICRITARDNQGVLLNICSGTLVAADKILTAAHCVIPDTGAVMAQCGFRGVKVNKLTWEITKNGTAVYTHGVQFLEGSTGRYTFVDRDHDQAVLTLYRELYTKPLKVRANYQIMSSDACHIEGFGRSNNAMAGILYSGPLTSIGPRVGIDQLADIARVLIRKEQGQISAYENIYLLPETAFITNGMNSVIGRRGDSGAPIICQRGNESYVVAVWAQILLAAPKIPLVPSPDSQNFESALHTSFSRLIRSETFTHIFSD